MRANAREAKAEASVRATARAGGLSKAACRTVRQAAALANEAPMGATFTGVLLGFAPVQTPLAVLEAAASVGIVRLLATRRSDLLPPPLQTVRGMPASGTAVALLLLSFVLPGCAYEGIDGTVFGAAAESAGRPPTDSLLDLSQGEMGLAMSILILFGLGFVAGRSWSSLFQDSNALPR